MDIAIYLIIFAILLAAFIFIPKKKKTRIFGIAVLTIALVLEIFVFNYHSYALVGKDYKETVYDMDSENLTIATDVGSTISMTLRDLSEPIGTIYVKCDLDPDSETGISGTSAVNVRIDAKDSTNNASYRMNVAKGQIIRGDDGSGYLVLNLSGDVTRLRIRLTVENEGLFRFESLTLNKAKPMEFSILRLLIIVGVATAVLALATFPTMLDTYENKKFRCRAIAMGLTVVLIIFAMVLTATYRQSTSTNLKDAFKQTSGDQITQELVDAFEAGQFELLDKPSKELLELENPYDWSEREQYKVDYKWDHLLYDGKYYSYYGIAPVVLLFLPYHLVTGYYFPTPEAVLIFGSLGILFLTLAYLAFCELFFKKLPLNIILSGLLICQLCSGVWYNFCSPLFYEIAQASGFCFTCAGFWLLMRSGVVGEGKIRLPSLCISTVCFSLSVLCRPTLALYCFAALIFIGIGLAKRIKLLKISDYSKGKKALSAIIFLMVALAPFFIIGGVQMYYNYARFGSVFDFGIQYSLTINDFTRAEFHVDQAVVGFHNFLFAFPNVKAEFPYIFSNFSELNLNGYYFIANENAIGLFFRALPTLAYLAVIPAFRSLTKKERLPASLAISFTCIIVPLVIIFTIWESGYGVRYCTDFAWQFILGGLAILYILYVRRAEMQVRKLMQYFFIVSLSVAFVCNFAMVYDYIAKTGEIESAFMSFERIFDFWM